MAYYRDLVDLLGEKLSNLPGLSYPVCCIYRVPQKLRRVSEEAFSPRLASIGPLHRGRPDLQAMELFKLRCLKSYLEMCSQEASGFVLESAVKWAKDVEFYCRQSYQDTIELSSNAFSEMILLDGVFIVVLFMKNYLRNQFAGRPSGAIKDEVAFILDRKWMVNDLLHDLMLLENQLPYFVPLHFFDILKSNFPLDSADMEFSTLTHRFFRYVGNTDGLREISSSENPVHLLHYLLMVHTVSRGDRIPPRVIESKGVPQYPSEVTVLQEAGVKFVTGAQNCLLEIELKDGYLTMPKLTVNEWTATFFLNLIAFEQCDHRPGFVSSYVIFMDSLIETPKDVDILVEHGVIEKSFGDTEAVCYLLNNLYKESVTDDTYFHLSSVSKELNDYSKDYWHQWKAAWFKWKLILKRDYFSNPWAIISVIAAIILLGLTVTQTACSVLAL